MRKVMNFFKNNILEILFLLGTIGIYVGYYFCLSMFTEQLAKALCDFCVFSVEFIWFVLVSSFAKTPVTLGKLLFLNISSIVCMELIVLFVNLPCPHPIALRGLVFLLGLFFFLFSWAVAAVIAKENACN